MNDHDWIYEYKKKRIRQYNEGELYFQSEIGIWYEATKRRDEWTRIPTDETKLLSGIEPQFWIPYEIRDDDIPF